jgi:hypothetical protein
MRTILAWIRNRILRREATLHPDALRLAKILESTWPALEHDLRASGVPLNEGEGSSGEASAEGDSGKDNEPSGEGGEGGEGFGEGPSGEGSSDKAPGEGDGELGEGGKRALQAERDARKKAEQQAREALNAHARSLGVEEPEKLSKGKIAEAIKEKQRAQLSKEEAAQDRAREAEEKAAAATQKARRANLLTALAEEQNLMGGKAKAAARLLDGEVEYDDDDEPTNLPDAIKAAKAEYGEDVFKGATPSASVADQGARGGAAQVTESALSSMTPEEIVKAQNEGRLDSLLKGS